MITDTLWQCSELFASGCRTELDEALHREQASAQQAAELGAEVDSLQVRGRMSDCSMPGCLAVRICSTYFGPHRH